MALKNLAEKSYESFKYFLFIMQIFFAAPWNIEFNQSSSTRESTKYRKLLTAANLISILLICIVVTFATLLECKELMEEMTAMAGTLEISEILLGYFQFLLAVVGCQYQKKNYKIFFKRFFMIDKNLQKCGVQPNLDATRTYLRRMVTIYLAFFSCQACMDFVHNKMEPVGFLISSTTYVYTSVVITLSLTQYSVVLHFATDKFKSINDTLKILITNNSLTERRVIKNRLHVISVLSVRIEDPKTDKTLKILRRQHAELSRLIEHLNQCFGLLIVLTIIADFVNISIEFFGYYKRVKNIETDGFGDDELFWTLDSIFWVTVHAAKVLLIIYSANNASDEQKRAANLIFNINYGLKYSDVAFELSNFSDQLFQLSPMQACSLVDLDLTLIRTIVGAVISNMMILIQYYDGSFDESDSETVDCICL